MATVPAEFASTDPHSILESSPSTLADVVRQGLTKHPKQLPPWLFYDSEGSELFDRITQLPEYYLTRKEREILTAHAGEMLAAAAGDQSLRLIELGAGSADKTRTLLAAAVAQQGTVKYQPVDVSSSALDRACEAIEAELPGVQTEPIVVDYTAHDELAQYLEPEDDEKKLLLWIGSSIGNFEPESAIALLRRIGARMAPGDGLLLGVDLAPCPGGKCIGELLAAYDDEAEVTARFNRNLLVRLNRELDADFDIESFAHCVEWNAKHSRIEMYLESLVEQQVHVRSLDLSVHFAAGERLHTENSYKYSTAHAVELMAAAGFPVVKSWTDDDEWFAVFLGSRA